jgi:hypothetical protein
MRVYACVQVVAALKGSFRLRVVWPACNLIRYILRVMKPHYADARKYYLRNVHPSYLEHLRVQGHQLPKHPEEVGFDQYWEYLVERVRILKKFPREWYEEEINVVQGCGVLLPPFVLHGGGEQRLEDGYSLRVHIYLNSEPVVDGHNGSSNVYDFRADRVLAPIARYFATTSTTFNFFA